MFAAFFFCASLTALRTAGAADKPATTAAVLPPQNNFERFLGFPVAAVNLEVPTDENREQLRKLIEVQPGFLLTSVDLQTSLKRLYALGRFSSVQVFAEPIANSVVLHFYLKAIRRIRAVQIIGNKWVSTGALLENLRIGGENEYDPHTQESVARQSLDFLRANGLPKAQVDVVESSPPNATEVVLTVTVNEGTPRRLKDLRFSGQTRVSNYILIDLAGLKPGDILKNQDLIKSRERLLRTYWQKGFLYAQVFEPELVGGDEYATVVFSINAGDRVAFFFQGNLALSERELLALRPTGESPLQNEDIEQYEQRILNAYQRLGYFQAQLKSESFRDVKAGITRYLFTIQEGEAPHVRDIRFVGTRLLSPELLSAQIRATLIQDLGKDRLVQPLTFHDLDSLWLDSAAAKTSAPPPPQERWIPEVYDKAFNEIAAAYHNQGYLSATVGPAELLKKGTSLSVTVPVHEGTQTFIRSLRFFGNEVFLSDELLGDLEQPAENAEAQVESALPGSKYSVNRVEDARITLLRRYRDHGYLYARIYEQTEISPDQKNADVSFRFEEGPQVRVENVLIQGNRYTLESVIRSRISLTSGDIYKLDQALQDQRAVSSLGVFSNVRVKLIDEEVPAEQKDLVAELTERNRHAIEFWPGISTAEGPRLRIDYFNLNVLGSASVFSTSLKVNRSVFFDLFGQYAEILRDRYRRFSLREQIEYQLRTGIRSPRILDFPFDPAFRFDFVFERDNTIPYSLDAGRTIFGLDLYPLDRVAISIEPQFSLTGLSCENTVNNVFSGSNELNSTTDCTGAFRDRQPNQRPIDQGLRAMFKVGPSITVDRRDDSFNPHKGIYFNAKSYWATGSLLPPEEGGTLSNVRSGLTTDLRQWHPFSFLRYEGTLSAYIPLKKLVLALSARAGSIYVLRDDAPIDERFFLGGRTTLRGFFEESLIPQDVCIFPAGATETDRPGCSKSIVQSSANQPPLSTGGYTFFLSKAELRVPFGEKISIGLFVDAGNLWIIRPAVTRANLRLGTGMGLRYSTPVGPIALDFGVNPRPRDFETATQLHFAIGVF